MKTHHLRALVVLALCLACSGSGPDSSGSDNGGATQDRAGGSPGSDSSEGGAGGTTTGANSRGGSAAAGGDTRTAVDADGNTYGTVMVGTQLWLSQDLRVESYRNGDPIADLTEAEAWSTTEDGAYSNLTGESEKEVLVYNWYAVNDPRGLCMVGFHVPSDEEWSQLTDSLGGEAIAAGKLKEEGLAHWAAPNEGATNESGFTALPTGYRSLSGQSSPPTGYNGMWWAGTGDGSQIALFRGMRTDLISVERDATGQRDGLAVRCLAD